jgi:tRNA (cytidine32/guanosine34-2'-O)-methyltransferase
MSPLPGVTTLRADITHPSTIPLLLKALDPSSSSTTSPSSSSSPLPTTPTNPVDLVISDGAPDVTGLHDLDIYIQSQLLWAALNLSLCVLKPGGKFVAKIFRGKDVDLLFAQLKIVFERVRVAKPRSSRASSIEAFVVCENFRPPDGFTASLERPLGVGTTISGEMEGRGLVVRRERTKASRTVRADGAIEIDLGSEDEDDNEDSQNIEVDKNRWIPPFLACGDLSAFDSDATYHLPKDRVVLEPVQPPTYVPHLLSFMSSSGC